MIIAANGAQKSGSTWQMHLALQIRPAAEPHESYWKPEQRSRPNYAIRPELLKAFLADPQTRSHDVLFKLHLFEPQVRDLLLADPLVRVLTITRNIRDITVSYYHHFSQYAAKTQMSFAAYYLKHGRMHIWRILTHRRVWQVSSPQHLCIDYDDLKRDQPANIRRMAAFLEVDVSNERVAEIIAATTPEAINQRFAPGPLNRFRKGTGGEWVDMLQQEHLDDIAALERAIKTPIVGLALHGPAPLRTVVQRFARLPRPLPTLRRTVNR